MLPSSNPSPFLQSWETYASRKLVVIVACLDLLQLFQRLFFLWAIMSWFYMKWVHWSVRAYKCPLSRRPRGSSKHVLTLHKVFTLLFFFTRYMKKFIIRNNFLMFCSIQFWFFYTTLSFSLTENDMFIFWFCEWSNWCVHVNTIVQYIFAILLLMKVLIRTIIIGNVTCDVSHTRWYKDRSDIFVKMQITRKIVEIDVFWSFLIWSLFKCALRLWLSAV